MARRDGQGRDCLSYSRFVAALLERRKPDGEHPSFGFERNYRGVEILCLFLRLAEQLELYLLNGHKLALHVPELLL
jgi:hypothetical protein